MLGESIALLVAVLWTTGAIFGELASKRLGALPLNVIRMVLSLLILGIALWFMAGHPYPYLADGETWMWLSLSGLMGFGFGDYCLFNSYMLIGSRFSQLFMTLAAPFAALMAWLMLGEHMTCLALIGMAITLTGIGMSILGKEEKRNIAGASNDSPKDKAPSCLQPPTSYPQNETQEDKVSSYLLPLTSYLPNISVKLPLHGVVFGIGAALGQGVGLVLSKVGLEHYTASAPLQTGMSSLTYPVGGTMIRALTGLVCFLLLLLMKKKVGQLKSAVHDGRGMHFAFWATMLGPAVGVSLSLLAVQYTSTGVAQTLMALTPVLIIWPSYLIFKSRITAMEIFGAIIAVCGAVLFFV